jgi:MYXO-CTERM domain-containing protein
MMTEALLAVYPDIFKAGASFAGVPAGCWSLGWSSASNWGSTCAGSGTPAVSGVNQTAQQWGDKVRAMYPGYSGHRPRAQLFHGDQDQYIAYTNLREGIKEWTNVLNLSTDPTSTDTGLTLGTHQATRQRWQNSCGYVVLEAITSIGGDHGPSDALFSSSYVIPFLGLDKTDATDPEITQCGAGGAAGSGGATSTGGTIGAGGDKAGGTSSTGGSRSATGGSIGAGGTLATGGRLSTGGAIATGGTGVPTGGSVGVGSSLATGGKPSIGSSVTSGGEPGTGGVTGIGGTTSVVLVTGGSHGDVSTTSATGGSIANAGTGSGLGGTASLVGGNSGLNSTGGSSQGNSNNSGGCSCSMGSKTSPSGLLAFVLGSVLALRRRRQRA